MPFETLYCNIIDRIEFGKNMTYSVWEWMILDILLCGVCGNNHMASLVTIIFCPRQFSVRTVVELRGGHCNHKLSFFASLPGSVLLTHF